MVLIRNTFIQKGVQKKVKRHVNPELHFYEVDQKYVNFIYQLNMKITKENLTVM